MRVCRRGSVQGLGIARFAAGHPRGRPPNRRLVAVAAIACFYWGCGCSELKDGNDLGRDAPSDEPATLDGGDLLDVSTEQESDVPGDDATDPIDAVDDQPSLEDADQDGGADLLDPATLDRIRPAMFATA
jgi:hypothetical protein